MSGPVLLVAGAFVFAHAASAAVPQVHLKSKVSTLAACPARGAEQEDTARALLNEIKHRVPSVVPPVFLDFEDIASLQRQADSLVLTGKDSALTSRDRAKLRDLTVRDRKVGEGDLVAMAGFVVGKPEANLGESVNCYLRGPSNNDFHLDLAATLHASPFDAIVVEMIPQNRPSGWTLALLRRLSGEGRQVLVAGQLVLDNIHQPNTGRGAADDPPRASIWEIHPVTRLAVCGRAENDCDPGRDEQWQPLGSLR
jgi:hypothetical protein